MNLRMNNKEQTIERMKRRSVLRMLYLGVIANISNISGGMIMGYSAVTLPEMRDKNATFHVNEDEASWVASLASFSTPVGALIVGPIADAIGRKWAILSLNLPSFVGWLCITFAYGDWTLELIYIGRVLTGIAAGMVTAPASIFVSEVSTETLRGMLVTWISVAFSAGLLFVYTLGTIFPHDWRIVAGISACFPLGAAIAIFFLLPETPSWLLLKGKKKQAELNYRSIRGLPPSDPMPSYFELEYRKMEIKLEEISASSKHSLKDILRAFAKASAIKPLVIMNTFFLFQQFSGTFVLIFYAVDVVQSFGIQFNAYYVAVVIGITRLSVTFFYGFISQRYGRRLPVMVSGVATTFFMFMMTLYLYCSYSGFIQDGYLSWLAVLCLILSIFSSTVGFLTLPWAMIGEVFPTKIRGFACGLTTCVANLLSFSVIKLFPDMINYMSMPGTFLFYSCLTLLATVFVTFFLPETQGKSLLEIEEEFDAKNNECKNHSGIYYLTEKFVPLPFYHPDQEPITERNVKISQQRYPTKDIYSYSQTSNNL